MSSLLYSLHLSVRIIHLSDPLMIQVMVHHSHSGDLVEPGSSLCICLFGWWWTYDALVLVIWTCDGLVDLFRWTCDELVDLYLWICLDVRFMWCAWYLCDGCEIYVMRMKFMWWMWDLCNEYEISLKDVKYMWCIVFVVGKCKKNWSVLVTLPSAGKITLGKVTICPPFALSKEFSKKIISLSSASRLCTRQRIFKKKNPECLQVGHSAKNFQKEN